MYRNTVDFYVLTLCPASLLNSFFSTQLFFGRIFKAFLHIRLCYLQTGSFMSSFPVWVAFVGAPTFLSVTQSCGQPILTAEQQSCAVARIILLSVDVWVPCGLWLSPIEVLWCCSVAQSCPALCSRTDCSMPGFPFTIFPSLLKLISTESVMPSNHLILCHRLLLPPSIWKSFSDLQLHLFVDQNWIFSVAY